LLEYANTQLLEFRYYDELLTNVLSDVYSSLEGRESFWKRFRLSRRAGRLNELRLDIMDLAERTEYAVKFISDTYYARVYRVASARIRPRSRPRGCSRAAAVRRAARRLRRGSRRARGQRRARARSPVRSTDV